MAQYGMVIDVTRCTACYCCFAACKDEYWENDYPPYSAAQPRYGQFWMNLLKSERGQYPHVSVTYMPMPCMQCENPACAAADSNGSVQKTENGVVIIDPVKAAGQKNLIGACPYGAIYWNEEKQLPQKCTFCLHRLEAGHSPRCVQVCPSECIKFGDLSDSQSEVSQLIKTSGAEVFHPEWGTRPKVYYIGLQRMMRLMMAGSVVQGDTGECAAGAEVKLKGPDGKNCRVVTNAFGDFSIDGLEAGRYTVKITADGYKDTYLEVDLKKSQSLGAIMLSRA